MTSAPPRDRFAASVVARDLVRRLARALAAEGIDVMPLKGVLLQQHVYADPLERPISDVDLLVRERDFARATAVLAREGLDVFLHGEAGTSVTLREARSGFLVDLHQRLFSPSWFRLGTGELFARARRDEALFDAPVYVIDALDLYAHLVGHFVKGRLGARDAHHVRDFAVVAERFALDARAVAQHLERHGLARAARYALGVARDAGGDAFAADVIAALRVDLLGDAIARVARVALQRPLAPVAVVPTHLLNASVARAARSLAVHAADVVRRRV